MTRLFAIAFALSLASCATPRTAPRFQAPSTKVVSESQSRAVNHVSAAKKKAVAIEQQEKDPALKLQVQSLQIDLDNALRELSSASGSVQQLQSQLDQQTKQANQLADSYDKSSAQITSLKVSRHRWVIYFWYSSGALALAVVWIFRKPILLLVSGL